MINVKVKTLDSQNHDFTVEEDITVRQFKDHIAETVNVVADQQRIIYCGRILNDEKQLKEYDVDGKVVHLVMRPPPGERPENSPLDNPQVPTPRHHRREPSGRLRSIDGVLNAMAMYVAGTPQAAAPSLNPSSTLCMNRITVARHMLQCASNLMNHLEDPLTPVNNAPMDILGQQTLESTVLEVGISAVSDVDQVDNIMQAFRGAVNAAFHQNASTNPEIAVVPGNPESMQIFAPAAIFQIPDPNGSGSASSTSTNSPSSSSNSASFDGNEPPTDQPLLTTEPVTGPPPPLISDTPETGTSTPPRGNRGAGAGGGANNPNNNRQQTTSTQTLAAVVQEMRAVQTRLGPFLQQYYDILQDDPTFTAENPATRENSQRLFDRVSEALHYMSHAQHAISDLMLDLSTNSPRHLCCRPILVEQSAFVSSGFGMPNISIRTDVIPPPHLQPTSQQAGGGGGQQPNGNNEPSIRHQHIATIPIIVQHTGPPSAEAAHATAAAAAALNAEGMQEQAMTRLFQSIFSAVPMQPGTVELRPRGGPLPPPAQNQAEPATYPPPPPPATTSASTGAAPPQSQARPVRATAANTLPTTSTQTRSTARPQVHVTSIQQQPQMRNMRPVPSNIFSAFDRFLPCNSHHIRENGPQAAEQQQNGTANGGRHEHYNISVENILGNIHLQPMLSRRRPDRAATNAAAAARPVGTTAPENPVNHQDQDLLPILTMVDLNERYFTRPVRNAVRDIISRRFFNNTAITEQNLDEGLAEILVSLEQILEPLAGYQHPDYCIRQSVQKLIKVHLREMLNLLRSDDDNSPAEERFPVNFCRSLRLFATNLIQILRQSNQRLQDIKQFFKAIFCIHVRDLELRPVDRILCYWLKICFNTLDKKFTANNIDDIIEFLVIKAPSINDEDVPMEVEDNQIEGRDLVEKMEATPSTSGSTSSNLMRRLRGPSAEEMDEDVPGAFESWHNEVPTAWIGTLATDLEEQQKITESQAQPLSDAYLDGMTKKRRKIINDARPTAPIPSLINSGVRRAIQNSGFPAQTPPEQISSQIASDTGLQNSFREAMHSSIKDRLRTDPNFDPKKHSNSSNYFK